MNPPMAKNRQILLASRPEGEPSEENFKLVEGEIPKPARGQMLVRTIYLSLDPYMRGRMSAGASYASSVEINDVMPGQSVCEVIESNIPDFRPGDMILADSGRQDYSLALIFTSKMSAEQFSTQCCLCLIPLRVSQCAD